MKLKPYARLGSKTKLELIRATVSIPPALVPWVNHRTAEPLHSGSFSSYVRALIIQDQAQNNGKDKAA